MKIFFVTPVRGYGAKHPTPWLGIAYLCRAVKDAGHEYDVLDPDLNDLSPDEFRRIIRKSDADLFGISCNVENRLEAFRTAALIKHERPDKLVIMGGPFPSIKHEQ